MEGGVGVHQEPAMQYNTERESSQVMMMIVRMIETRTELQDCRKLEQWFSDIVVVVRKLMFLCNFHWENWQIDWELNITHESGFIEFCVWTACFQEDDWNHLWSGCFWVQLLTAPSSVHLYNNWTHDCDAPPFWYIYILHGHDWETWMEPFQWFMICMINSFLSVLGFTQNGGEVSEDDPDGLMRKLRAL